jgi:hypothetical protein
MIASAAKPRLGHVLLDLGLLDAAQLSTGLAEQRRRGERIGETLVRLGVIDSTQLGTALAEQRRRWIAAAFGTAMMALQPVPAMARSASAQLSVSLHVVDATNAAAPASPKITETIGPDGATIAFACAQPSLVRVSAPAMTARAVACTQAGQPVAIAIPLAALRAGAAGPSVSVEISS